MPAPTKNAANVDFRTYDVTYGGATLGWCNDVDPSGLKIVMADKKIGEIGDIAIDKVVVGLTGSVKITLAQCDVDVLRAATPWAGATGAFPIVPATQYQSLYSYARVLILHPRGVTGTAEDLTLVKAVALPSWIKMSTGNKQREFPVEFEVFPDQTQLVTATPTLVYGYIGPAPT